MGEMLNPAYPMQKFGADFTGSLVKTDRENVYTCDTHVGYLPMWGNENSVVFSIETAIGKTNQVCALLIGNFPSAARSGHCVNPKG